MKNVLIVDDESGIRTILKDILDDEGYKTFTVEDGYECLDLLKTEVIDLVLLDIWLPNIGGIDVLKEIKKEYTGIEVVVISGHANIKVAVEAIKLGAFDFLEKPLSLEKVTTVARNALNLSTLKRENENLKNSLFIEDEMIGSSPGVEEIRSRIRQSAVTDSRILILGENGTGKELVAREIHRQSRRDRQPFVEVNCAAIPDTLIESELFGHEKGSFTSAIARRKGRFELAHKGTLFLDEVADMSLSAQAKVLRVVQEMRFERIGGEEAIEVDVRILSATNKDIKKEIAEGRFREDLFFRLNVIPIYVPALRERKDDLPELISYFVERLNKEKNDCKRSFDEGAMRKLTEYSWPGNIRELKNFIERVTIMSDEDVISANTAEFYLGENHSVTSSDTTLDEYNEMQLNEAKDQFERSYLVEKLKENGYNISRTAAAIGIYPSNLHGKIKKFGIEPKK